MISLKGFKVIILGFIQLFRPVFPKLGSAVRFSRITLYLLSLGTLLEKSCVETLKLDKLK